MTVCIVLTHGEYYFGDHLFQFVKELLCIIFPFLNLTKFLLPNSGKLRTLEHLLMDESNEFHTRGGSYEVFTFLTDVTALEQGLYYGSPGRRASYAVFLQGIAKFFIVDEFACRLHCPQKSCFGIWFRRLSPLLHKRWFMRP